jgi:hypothetical protein
MEVAPMTDMTAADSVTVDSPHAAAETSSSSALDAIYEQLIDRLV